MSDVRIITNNHPRDILHSWDLTATERTEFDWIDSSDTVSWDEAEFFRYRGQAYYVESEGTPAFAPGWDAYLSDSFFSGIVYRYPVTEPANRYHDAEIDYESVVVGTYLA